MASAASSKPQEQPTKDLLSLPDDLLRICLRAPALDEAAKTAALASCKPVAGAVLRTSLRRVAVDVRRPRSAAVIVKLLARLWGEPEGPQEGRDITLALFSGLYDSPARCLDELRAAGVRLPLITTLLLTCLSLDQLLPVGVGALPNLRQLFVNDCMLTAAARTTSLDASCTKLHHLNIGDLLVAAPDARRQAAVATAQLRQLARLPSLSSVALLDTSCPTLFLVALGTQLTRLVMDHAYRQCEPGTQTPAPAWRATLQQVARCTGLRDLHIPCGTLQELRMVAPALQQLRALTIATQHDPDLAANFDGDAMLEALLGLPHLTSLWWCDASLNAFRGPGTEGLPAGALAQCQWERLEFGLVAPQVLARLPLHPLKQPLEWEAITIDRHTTPPDARAAAANVTRRCPAGFKWKDLTRAIVLFGGGHRRDEVASILLALQPLLAPLPQVALLNAAMDVAEVRALGQALPRACTRVFLVGGSMSREALVQVPVWLPWVRWLTLRGVTARPIDVVGLLRAARHAREEEQQRGEEGRGSAPGASRAKAALKEVVVEQPQHAKGSSEVRSKRAWDEATREVERMGAGVTLRVEW